MTTHDIRDVLNLPADGLGPRPSKKHKTSTPRPNLKGLAREVQNLGGDNPIAIVPELSLYKKRRLASRKPAAKWELSPFRNSARDDQSLILRHWRRKSDPEPQESNEGAETRVQDGATDPSGDGQHGNNEIEDSAFAKYNAQVVVPQYSEDQYTSTLQSKEWTKDETDYLMELVKDFDLRWPVIWDRYDYSPKPPEGADTNTSGTDVILSPKPRTMEDLKARYYEVAAKMMDVQKPVQWMTGLEWNLHQMMANFDPNQERRRKEFALKTMARSKEEAREEESLLLEVKRIVARSEKFNEERRELYSRLDYPHPEGQDIAVFKTSGGLANLLHTLTTVDKSRKRKSIMAADGVSPAGSGPNGQPGSANSEAPPSRHDSVVGTSAGHRESVGADKSTPASHNKKGHPQPERRRLNQQEEQVYGVSTHDRLGSGPTFRYEKVNKLFSHKSGQQQTRIQNILTELDIPPRLSMPTAPVVAEYEKLILSVTTLVDLRKLRDKVDTEIKIEEAKKVERAKARAVLGQGDGASDRPPAAQDKDKKKAAEAPAVETGGATKDKEKDEAQQKQSATDAAASSAPPADAAQKPGDKQPEAPTTNADASGASVDGAPPSTVQVPVKEGESITTNTEKEKAPGLGSGHKRSASVLSSTSNKSAKRQKN